MTTKISIRFFDDKEVRAVWDEQDNKWWFSVVDVCGALNGESDNTKNRKYWSYLKRKLQKEESQLASATRQLKLMASDGKKYLTDLLDSKGIIELSKSFPNNKASKFTDWFVYSDNTIDGQSKKKAYDLWESGLLNKLEAGTIKCLQQIHGYIFGGLYDFAGQIRNKNISKGGFSFAPCQHFHITLSTIEKMPETNFDEIAANPKAVSR